jgi:hypothetical protein
MSDGSCAGFLCAGSENTHVGALPRVANSEVVTVCFRRRVTPAGWQRYAGSENNTGQLTSDLPAVQNTDYGLRLLETPGLNLRVFWLKTQPPVAGDLVVTTQPIPGFGTPITMAKFLSVIGPMATRRLAVSASGLVPAPHWHSRCGILRKGCHRHQLVIP